MKIFLVADKITNENDFIIFLRKLLNISITEIKNSLKNKSSFFQGNRVGPNSEENEDKISQILRYAEKNSDSIKIYQVLNENAKIFEDSDEISSEYFFNSLETDKQIDDYFKKLDLKESRDDE